MNINVVNIVMFIRAKCFLNETIFLCISCESPETSFPVVSGSDGCLDCVCIIQQPTEIIPILTSISGPFTSK